MRNRALLLFVLYVCLPVAAQTLHKNKSEVSERDRPASDAHSFMELFSKLENGVTLAIQHKNTSELDTVLAPEFIVRSADNPEHPTLRADWIRQVSNWSLRSYDLRAFAIRAFANEAIVSYVENQQGTFAGQDRSGDYFVVDLWVVTHGNWQLAARYLSLVTANSNGSLCD